MDCHLDRLLAEREMTLTALATRVGMTVANLSILKSNGARAIGFSILTRNCTVLECQRGDFFILTTLVQDSAG